MNFETFKTTPKGECHVHLEGSMTPQRVAEMATEQPQHPWHGMTAEALKKHMVTHSFEGFLDRFMKGYRLLCKGSHFQKVTEDLLATLQQQGVTHTDILYSPGLYIQRLGIDLATIHDGIEAGLAQFPDLSVRMILDTVLNMGYPFMETTLNAVLADRRHFNRGFSVGGGDPDLDMKEFVPLFHKAQKAGLFCVAHVGEVDGPENMKTLILETDLKRIAHGCAANDEVCELIKGRNITIDVSLTSNVKTGSVKNLSKHPIKGWVERGIPVTLNTDDPFYFDVTLYGEYQLAQNLFGFSDAQLKAFAEQSLRVLGAK